MKGFITGKGKGTYDSTNPILTSNLFVIDDGTGVKSVTGDLVDNTDPQNPIINNPEIPEQGVQTVSGKWVNPTTNDVPWGQEPSEVDPKNPIVWNNNYVRRLKIPYASLVSYDEAGVLQYINYQMPLQTGGPFIIEEDEIFVIEITGIPSDGGEQEMQLTLSSPVTSQGYDVGDIITITSLYSGGVTPSKIEHYIQSDVSGDEYLVATQTDNFYSNFTSTYSQRLSVGNYDVIAKLYINDSLVPTPRPVVPIVISQSGTEPDYALEFLAPDPNTVFDVEESFEVISLYSGQLTPSRIEKHIGQFGEPTVLFDTYTTDFWNPHSSFISLQTEGRYELTLKLFDSSDNEVLSIQNEILVIFVEDTPNEPSITYYPLSQHRAGSYSSGNAISVVSTTYTGDKFYRREAADGTLRDENLESNSYVPPSPYLAGDIVKSTVPLDEIIEYKSRYNQVQGFMFNFSTQMPNLELLWLRGNEMYLGDMDLSGCRNLRVLDISRNFINSITLPVANNPQNVFEYAYVGDWDSDGSGQAPRQVINTIMEYAYYSTYNGAQDSLHKVLNTGPNVGTINYKGLNLHKLLVDKGWQVNHISTEEAVYFSSAGASSKSTPIMCSHYNWSVGINASWLSCSNPSGYISNNVQNINLSVTANTTGAPRETIMTVHKWKTDGSGEFHYRAEIKITQAG